MDPFSPAAGSVTSDLSNPDNIVFGGEEFATANSSPVHSTETTVASVSSYTSLSATPQWTPELVIPTPSEGDTSTTVLAAAVPSNLNFVISAINDVLGHSMKKTIMAKTCWETTTATTPPCSEPTLSPWEPVKQHTSNNDYSIQ
ncbi:hypothetical protein BDEG_28446 [Batrachochytrium dendrobatidis JEL423]|uniref:Uncharacterized protein n=1 Tax=Batrachochytrium dendrobatidis (strain JEL423) TaxID=403673 RepID=A0A177WZB2_BATDL|nr:hypothetical protein BDEG_28446 [Batrachochytrium dendrobatidis JEL423]